MKVERRSTLVVVLSLVLAGPIVLAGVDVHVERDKNFDFRTVRTWNWHRGGHGDLIMARTQADDPAAVQPIIEPWIVESVERAMAGLGLTRVGDNADVVVKYYVLLSTNLSSQSLGQFLPAVAAWGLPPFAAATQSLKYMNRGSLVIDLSAKDTVVWRGLAATDIKPDADNIKREAIVREAVRDLLRRYPKKS